MIKEKLSKTDYKKLFGITLKEAKIRAVAILGRYPKCGYEVTVKTGVINYHHYTVSLVNSAGRFYLHQWISPNFCFGEI